MKQHGATLIVIFLVGLNWITRSSSCWSLESKVFYLPQDPTSAILSYISCNVPKFLFVYCINKSSLYFNLVLRIIWISKVFYLIYESSGITQCNTLAGNKRNCWHSSLIWGKSIWPVLRYVRWNSSNWRSLTDFTLHS